MTNQQYYEGIRDLYRDAGKPERAQKSYLYMKGCADFFGLMMAEWMGIGKKYATEKGWPDGPDLVEVVRRCFADDHRELHYFALEITQKQVKTQPPDFIFFLEELILEKSWWDTVDWIAKLVALFFQKNPNLIRPTVERWMASENRWLMRVAITFQRYYREKTDTELLFECIRKVRGSREFFLQKGAGWALRELSKSKPELVRQFVENTDGLAPLTRREALRLMKN